MVGPGASGGKRRRLTASATVHRTGREYIGAKVLKQFLEPYGLFEGTIIDVTRDKDECVDDQLTFHVLYEDGTTEQWDENSLMQGQQLWLCVNQSYEVESGNDATLAIAG